MLIHATYQKHNTAVRRRPARTTIQIVKRTGEVASAKASTLRVLSNLGIIAKSDERLARAYSNRKN